MVIDLSKPNTKKHVIEVWQLSDRNEWQAGYVRSETLSYHSRGPTPKQAILRLFDYLTAAGVNFDD